MKPHEAKSTRARRMVAELFAIVFGILLAFSLQASWEARSERQSERELLGVLQTELREARQQLGVQLDIYVYLERATKTVADLLEANGVGTVTVADTLLAGVIFDMSYDPPTGTATTLLASGQIDLLRNLELRRALAAWPAAIEDGVEEQLSSWRLGDDHLEPLLQGAVGNLGPTYSVMALWSREKRIVSHASEESRAVTASPELWNAVYQQLSMIRNARTDLVGVTQAHLDKLETLVARELGQ